MVKGVTTWADAAISPRYPLLEVLLVVEQPLLFCCFIEGLLRRGNCLSSKCLSKRLGASL